MDKDDGAVQPRKVTLAPDLDDDDEAAAVAAAETHPGMMPRCSAFRELGGYVPRPLLVKK